MLLFNGKMIVQKDFLNKLRDFGLNSYEAKLWTALLSRGVSTAGELSDIANVPRSRSYDVLESLEKKGFIIMKLGKPIKYIAVKPGEVVERVKKKLQEEVGEKTRIMDQLRGSEVLQELSLLFKEGVSLVEPTELSGSFKGRTNIYNHLEGMLKNANKSITIVTTGIGLVRKSEAFKHLFAKAREHKVKIRIAAPITKETIKAARQLEKYAEVKHTTLKSRFCIIDGKEMMFMIMDDSKIHSSYDVGIWVKTELFANTIQNFFETEWKNMSSLDQVKV